MWRALVKSQMWLCSSFDRLLPARFRVHGNQDFLWSLVPKYLLNGLTVYEIGGGKTPYLSPAAKKALNIKVIGLDIDMNELARAPEGAYDETICADITQYEGRGDADIVICQALLEHVQDTEAAIGAIASILRPGGLALIFVPSRNAIYARLNMVMPKNLKRRILYAVFPDNLSRQGFPSYYDRCTPSGVKELADRVGLLPVEERYYYFSHYFSFFFPLYLIWRLWIVAFWAFYGEQAAETFSLVLGKKANV